MPIADLHGFRMHYEWSGATSGPVLLFSNSLGTDCRLWQSQAEAFGKTYRVLRYDTRGHGRSSTPPGAYTLGALAGDALALMDHAGIDTAVFCGISLGALTGLALAIAAPQRLSALIAANTAARIGTTEGWTTRIKQVQSSGMQSLFEGTLTRWFTADFLARQPWVRDTVKEMLGSVDATGYASCCAALRDADLRDDIASIRVPTLLFAGSEDAATTVAEAQFLAARIRDARLVVLPAAHLSNLEAAETFNQQSLRFLQTLPAEGARR